MLYDDTYCKSNRPTLGREDSRLERKMNKRSLGILLGILVAAAVGVAISYYSFSPVVVEGVVDHKAVSGEKGHIVYSIVLNTPEGILVKDKDYEGLFLEKDGNLLVDESLENKLKTEYSKINYLVSIRLTSEDPVNRVGKGEALAYFVSRDDFNELRIGHEAKFEVARFQSATMEKLYAATLERADRHSNQRDIDQPSHLLAI